MALSEQGSTNLPWHDDEKERIRIGDEAELEFEKTWQCAKCHMPFKRQHYPKPDFVCSKCGVEVDVKASPDAEKYRTITISQPAFDSWSTGVFIAWRPRIGEWRAVRKFFCNPKGPFKPTHRQRPTPFYKISIDVFDSMSDTKVKSYIENLI